MMPEKLLRTASNSFAEEIVARTHNVYLVYQINKDRPDTLCAVIENPEGLEPKIVLGRWLQSCGLSIDPSYRLDRCPVTSWHSITTACKPFPRKASSLSSDEIMGQYQGLLENR